MRKNNIKSGDRSLEENDIIKFRVTLKKEDPSTDIKNVKGLLTFRKKNLLLILNPIGTILLTLHQ